MSTNAAASADDGISIIDGGAGEALTTSAFVAGAVTGSHVLQIKGYSRTKGVGCGNCIKSTTFSVAGRRWYIRYYPDGNVIDNADWISIYLHLDPADAAAIYVKARYRFGVLDYSGELGPTFTQDRSSLHLDNTFSSKTPSWGFPKFVQRKALEESSYLTDVCLKVRCDIIVSKGIFTEPTVPPSDMHRHFGSLLSGAVGADVTFEVAGEMFVAHRSVLAASSPVFMAQLFGHMKEMKYSIRIQGMEARVFKAMLHFIYTDTVPEIHKEDVFVVTQRLLVAADRYDLERLKLICEDRLCMCIDTSTVLRTLALAERHGCHGLKNACFQLLKSSPSHLKTVMATKSFDLLLTMCPSLIKELLAKMAN